jgi:hypothetical protein
MAQPETAPAPRRTLSLGSWPLSRVLMLVAAVCMVIAAFTETGDLHWGPALAWVFGGLSAWALASVV